MDGRSLVTRALRKRSSPHSQPCTSCGSLYASSMLAVTPVFWNLHRVQAYVETLRIPAEALNACTTFA